MVTVVALVLINIALTAFSIWGAADAFHNKTSFNDVIGINAHQEVLWYLIPLAIACVSALVKPVRLLSCVCAFVITLCGAYVIYDTWDDTLGNAHDCLGNAGLDLDEQLKCVEQVTPKPL